MKLSKKIYISLNLETLAVRGIHSAIIVDTFDWSSLDSMRGKVVSLNQMVIDVDVPDNVAELGIKELEKALEAHRAEAYVKEQQLIDAIASLRLLNAPKEVAVLDDRDLRQAPAAPFDDGKDADDAEYTDLPF